MSPNSLPVSRPAQPTGYAWEATDEQVAERYGVPVEQVVRFDLNTSPAPPDLALRLRRDQERERLIQKLLAAKRKGARSIAVCNVVGSMATREADGTITHNLRTAVVDPAGRVFAIHDGNNWTPAQLVDELKRALATSSPARISPAESCFMLSTTVAIAPDC
mgnify:CR=1 FL=1